MRQRELETACFQQTAHALLRRDAMELPACPQTEAGSTIGMLAMRRRASRHRDVHRLAGGRPHHPQIVRPDGLLLPEMENENLDLLVGHMHLVGTRAIASSGREEERSARRRRRRRLPVSLDRYTRLGGLSQMRARPGGDRHALSLRSSAVSGLLHLGGHHARDRTVQRDAPAPNRHPSPDHRLACRASASRITVSLPATCSSRRARVMPV